MIANPRPYGKPLGFCAALLTIIVTLLPLTKMNQWWIRMWDFPRIQIAILSLLSAAMLVLFARPFEPFTWMVLTALLLVTVYQAYCILPYTRAHPPQVESANGEPGERIKMLASNVLMYNKDASRLLELVDRLEPDLVLLSEPNANWTEQMEVIHDRYPHRVCHPLENTYGIAFYSKFPLRDPRVEFVQQEDIPSIRCTLLLPSGQTVEFFGIHPRPPAPGESDDTAHRDAELVMVGRKVKEIDLPVIVAGDLNDVAWSRTTTLFKQLSGTLDPRIGRGLFNTFHANYFFLRFPLDHVFHTNHFRLAQLRCLPNIGSDHFPILIELCLQPTAEVTQEEPEPDKEDDELADEMIEVSEEKAEKEAEEDTSA